MAARIFDTFAQGYRGPYGNDYRGGGGIADALGPVIALTVILGFILALRYMRHRENLKMIEHGISPQQAAQQRNAVRWQQPNGIAPVPASGGRGRAMLGWGLATAAVGLALTLALWPIGFLANARGGVHFPLGIGPWMVAGFIPLFVGLALVLAYVLAPPAPPAPMPASYWQPAPPPIEPMPPTAPTEEFVLRREEEPYSPESPAPPVPPMPPIPPAPPEPPHA